MKKLSVLIAVALLAVLTTPTVVLADDLPSDAITVTVTGNGTWSDGTLSMFLFPGESKCFEVAVQSNWDSELSITAEATPDCLSGYDITACFCPTEAVLAVNAACVFNLTVTASGSAPPGIFSANLTIEADAVDVPPEVGVPDRIVLVSAQTSPEVGNPHELTATVYDEAGNLLPGISVEWEVLTGSATLSSVGYTTNTDGQAHATAESATVGSATVQCSVASSNVSATIDLAWVESTVVLVPNIRTPVGAITFGELLVDGALDRTVTIYNDGTGPLVIASIVRSSGSEDFTYISPTTPFTVVAGGSAIITVRFSPSVVGELSATFAITSNDPDTPSVSFAVSGVGRSRGQPAWLVFLIGVLIIGGGFGGYIYYKRWRAKREGLDVLARSGDGLDGLGGLDDELHLPD